MLGHTRGKRSPITCALKCDNACDKPACNTSSNEYFRDIAEAALSRRVLMGAGAAGALALALNLPGSTPSAQAAGSSALGVDQARLGHRGLSSPGGTPLRFAPIAPVPAETDRFITPPGFAWRPVIRWGDPLFHDSPEFDPDHQSAEAQRMQFGYNNDYTEIQEVPGSRGRRALMFVNHEYTNENIMFPDDMPADQKARIGMEAHGLTVVEIARKNRRSPYSYVRGAKLNRRFVSDTTYRLTGPAAGHPLLRTVQDPGGRTVHGTFGNCSGGLTPWGTFLAGEENFNGYFVTNGTSAEDKRYGLTSEPTVRGWEKVEDRFDTRKAGYENEKNRFGWIVEVDPWDPTSTPRKHTSLGRFKHEGANVIIAKDGRVVAYSGDDERFDYLYKFVSRAKYRPHDRAHNLTLLEEGDLYVAKFFGDSPASEIDGSGTVPSDGRFDGYGCWLPLVVGGKSAVPGMSVAEVLVNTRLAADKVGPTKMDRCEDVEPSLHSGRVYVACTNNTDRGKDGKAGPDEVNPRARNRDGHVVEIDERGNHSSQRFAWNLLLVCGDPTKNNSTYFGGFPSDQVSPISCPDNLTFDSVGNLWISTDGAPSTMGYCDGLFRVTLHGHQRGRVEQFISVPREAETCGPVVRDQDRTAFVAVQHPGENGTWDDQRSYFPDYDGTLPRPAVVQIYPRRGRN
ncbi:PhoX family protein [Devriesea agamarum]|uniref:PhoX family protein n=1 Tax=Devriesea agamarum TaxID=472569 RepID=UPI00071CB6BA|nr:PhoX family phosphatase [Devriesea agamarum]